jgi:hypothetical protein
MIFSLPAEQPPQFPQPAEGVSRKRLKNLGSKASPAKATKHKATTVCQSKISSLSYEIKVEKAVAYRRINHRAKKPRGRSFAIHFRVEPNRRLIPSVTANPDRIAPSIVAGHCVSVQSPHNQRFCSENKSHLGRADWCPLATEKTEFGSVTILPRSILDRAASGKIA